MKKVNLIIAKRNRDKYLDVCLQSLDICNERKLYDVCVYIVDDFACAKAYKTFSIQVECIKPIYFHSLFCKSALLNLGLERMRKDYDWLSIVDVDMFYLPGFFEKVEKVVDSNYVICTGLDLSMEQTKELHNQSLFPEWYSFPPKEGPSQISLSKKMYEQFLSIYGKPFYCEEFKDWGREDSEISFKSTDMQRAGLIKKVTLSDTWLHQWHIPTADLSKNKRLLEEKIVRNRSLLKRYLEGVK